MTAEAPARERSSAPRVTCLRSRHAATPRTVDPTSSRLAWSSTRCSLAVVRSSVQTAVETLSAIIRDDPTPVAELNPSIPVPVRWIVERCLAKRPADRYGSTRDLARNLASARDHFSELTNRARRPYLPAPASVGRRELVAWLARRGDGDCHGRRDCTAGAQPPSMSRSACPFDDPAPEGVNFDTPFLMSPFADPRRTAAGVRRIGNDGTRRLWIHSFDSLESRPFPGTEGGVGPFWSPDGQAVGFFTEDTEADIDRRGDVVHHLRRPWRRRRVESGRRDCLRAGDRHPLFRVAAAGGTPTPITALDPVRRGVPHIGPLLLPDSRRFLFTTIAPRENGSVFVGLARFGRADTPVDSGASTSRIQRARHHLFHERPNSSWHNTSTSHV